MQVTEPKDAQRHAVLYQATIDHAVRGAPDLMARLVAHARAALRDQESRAHDARERERLTASRRHLNQCEGEAVRRFAEELQAAFGRMAALEQPVAVDAGQPHFDEIAGMDAAQAEQSVENARVRHAVQIAADRALVELNGLICELLGLKQVQLERNPLRPAVYVDAVAAALAQLSVSPAVRQGWLPLMSGALGLELDVYYRQLCSNLREQGVGAITPAGAAAHAPGDGTAGDDAPTLTFERLRALLAGTPARRALAQSDLYQPASEPAPLDASDTVSDASPGAFQATVPAAFEAARDMKQLARVARRLEGRLDAATADDHPLRAQLRREAHGLDQSLALEVVALMVDNIRHDPRLLAPVRELVAQLEPALLKLALVDPQFFSHKQHPARKLLHEITYRSIAYESPDSRGFSGFLEPLHDAIVPLADAAVTSAAPFDQVLSRLTAVWDGASASQERQQVANAVKALQQAEQRALLATTIVREVLQRPDAVQVPSRVLDFLCGPWAQVVAHARMTDRSGLDDPGQYAQTIDTLMWSLQPALTSQDLPALRREVPMLQQRLRQGLASIDYPQEQSDAWLQLFDQMHQRALNAQAFADTELLQPQGTLETDSVARWNAADNSAWLVPAEAQASGFIDMQVDDKGHDAPTALGGQLAVGAWVALMVDGHWTRTRLAWNSSNGCLLLFVDALEHIQSLSRRACEQMYAQGQLRIISSDPVEDALDAVARTALRNSVDVKF
ncbi:DUF1631 family protein [Comamonadaceae bacterium G21597-S1]|nr:DUF1631 family protein [Comamonadaceae bacterium G21597-S1]